MSVLSRIKDKIDKKEYNQALATNGIALSTIEYQNGKLMQSRVFLCAVRALLIFMACMGTTGAVVSAFSLPFNFILVASITLIISILIAFIYYNSITFYIGYITYFVTFAFSAIYMYWYVNSGFQEFMNNVNQEYSDYFYLNSAREASIAIDNPHLTVSVAMIFVSAFLALLLNITISGYMNLPETFLLTFPLVQVALYIEKKPGLIYVIMLLTVYITVAILGRSGHYKLPDIAYSKRQFLTIKKKKEGKKQHNYTYISDGFGMITNTLWSVIFCIVFIMLTSTVFYSNLDAQHETNQLKSTTDEYVKSFVQNGIFSFFDRYNAKGGLSKGRLGGVSSVRPDYQTDLIVEYIPVNSSTVYLKSYIGTNYNRNEFSTNPETDVYNYNHSYIPSYLYSYPDYNPYENQATAHMRITNVDADTTLDYMPYYSASFTDKVADDEGQIIYELEYQPFDYMTSYSSENVPSDEYEQFVYETYLGIPDYLTDCLETFIDEADIDKERVAFDTAKTPEEKQLAELVLLLQLKKYIYSEYSYTMAPGTTPYNSDFIEYFLSSQKRGYCAHFASSSTLILRSLGIPARYIEGYVIQPTDLLEADVTDEDADAWIDESLNLGLMGTGVVSVEVTDGSAHAWTEVYIDGFGWIPYDFTPPSGDEMISGNDFSAILAGLFMTRLAGGDIQASGTTDTSNILNNAGSNFSFSLKNSLSFVYLPLFVIFIMAFMMILLRELMPSIKNKIIIKHAESKQNFNLALASRYRLFSRYYLRKSKKNMMPTPIELASYVSEHIENTILTPYDCSNFSKVAGQAIYSTLPINKADYTEAVVFLKKLKKYLV